MGIENYVESADLIACSQPPESSEVSCHQRVRFYTFLIRTNTMPTIRLQSSDGEVFPVEIEIAKQSVTIKTMLEDLGIDEDEEEIVPLPNVNAAILKQSSTGALTTKTIHPRRKTMRTKKREQTTSHRGTPTFSKLIREPCLR